MKGVGLLLILAVLINISTCSTSSGSNRDRDVKLTLLSKYGEKVTIFGDQCGAGVYFQNGFQSSCACVNGIWAFYSSWCSIPVHVAISGCVDLTDSGVSQVSLLSSPESVYFPSLAHMSPNMEQLLGKVGGDSEVKWRARRSTFFSVGAPEWELKTSTANYCLKHQPNTTFCVFSDIGAFDILEVKIGCTTEEDYIFDPSYCSSPAMIGPEADTNDCKGADLSDLDSPYAVHGVGPSTDKDSARSRMIVKREANLWNPEVLELQDHPPPRFSEDEGTEFKMRSRSGLSDFQGDEDFLDPLQAMVRNNPLLMDMLGTHVEGQISEILGNKGPYGARDHRHPVIKLLEMSLAVMKKICDVVSPDYLEMAVDTFINIQLNTLHVKEPYINHPSYIRIQKALGECLANAGPHVFQNEDGSTTASINSPVPVTECDQERKKAATNKLLRNGTTHQLIMPEQNKATGFEPIIETTWKILVNAHSYCYRFFSDYYNDHHSYTVSIMPLFTNEIQYMWMPEAKNGRYEDPGEDLQLYGGVIGDHVVLLNNIDMCVAASRVGSAYPWFMNRPPRDKSNKWRRRKRETSMEGQVCLKSPKDLSDNLKLPKCHTEAHSQGHAKSF